MTAIADSAAREDLLERYARLAIRVGINLEPGREVAIRAMIEHAPLVRALVRAGYEAGARLVEVDYEDPEVLRSQIALAPDEAVGTAPRWRFERFDDVREERRAQVSVIGFPPDDRTPLHERASPAQPGERVDRAVTRGVTRKTASAHQTQPSRQPSPSRC